MSGLHAVTAPGFQNGGGGGGSRGARHCGGAKEMKQGKNFFTSELTTKNGGGVNVP